MSVLEDLQGLEGRVVARMQELRPLVDEYQQLEQVARRLGLEANGSASSKVAQAAERPAASTPAAPARTVSRARAGGKAASRNRGKRAVSKSKPKRSGAVVPASATEGGRRQQIVDLVGQRPGITVRQIGQEFGIDPTNLYRIVRRLERDGTLKKRGRELLLGKS